MNERKTKRVTMKLKTPNPLFEQWIIEWRDKAKQENSKMEFCFSKALTSLRKYPVPLESGRECKILKGFGDKLCQMLDSKLEKFNQSDHCSIDISRQKCMFEKNDEKHSVGKKRKTQSPPFGHDKIHCSDRSSTKEYIPLKGSGGYAILVALYKKGLESTYPGYLTKLELIQESQYLATNSFTKPDPGSKYTAWSSTRTLLSKKLLDKKGNPAKFSLTNAGYLLAQKLYNEHNHMDIAGNTNCPEKENVQEKVTTSNKLLNVPINDLSNAPVKEDICNIKCQIPSTSLESISSTFTISSIVNKSSVNKPVPEKNKILNKHTSSSSIASSSITKEECVIFAPDSFDIILYVDTQETSGSQADIRDDPLLVELKSLSVVYEVKHLKVGDYTWICRDKSTKKELVLPYIVERKRLDDLAHSIKDGRFHEQKYRLKKCGIQNITYLIEKYKEHVGLPLASLYQAATNTAIQDGFCLKFTENFRDTAKYLAHVTYVLIRLFKSKTIASCPKENLTDVSLNDDLVSLMTFNEFNNSSSKNKPLKVTDLFVKMLIQIKGMSVEKALAIVQVYPTPLCLKKAYEKNPGSNGENLLAHISGGENKKRLGVVLSKTVYQLFTKDSF